MYKYKFKKVIAYTEIVEVVAESLEDALDLMYETDGERFEDDSLIDYTILSSEEIT